MKKLLLLLAISMMFFLSSCDNFSSEINNVTQENLSKEIADSPNETELDTESESEKRIINTEIKHVVFNSHVVIQDDFESEKPEILIVGGCLEIVGQINPPSEKAGINQPLQIIQMNPSCLITDALNIIDSRFVLEIGLGGNEPASPSGYGYGHYSQITANQLTLNGTLNLSFYYGFHPEIGKEYKIIKVLGTRTGEFINAAEGVIVGGICDVGLKISYQGTDGADVVTLTGVQAPSGSSWPCPTNAQGGNWDELGSWENGSVPSEADQVIISNLNNMIITEQVVNIKELTINNANLRLVSSCLDIKGNVHAPQGGMDLNPSCLIADRLGFGSSEFSLKVGIGGAERANPEGQGPGHYSNLTVNQIFMDGNIDVSFLYGFQPEAGQIFEIISVSDFGIGKFSNAPESEIIGGICDIGLSISYTGGDGNDVILTALKVSDPDPEWPCSDNVIVMTDSVANCRSGPATIYPILRILSTGEETIVLGQNAAGDWVFVELSDGLECWLWEENLEEESKFDDAVVLEAPPTPTPQPTVIVNPTATAITISPTATSISPTATPIIPTATPIPSDPMNASISGLVFKDAGTIGTLDGADEAYGGITVNLGLGACSSSGLASTTTGGDGSYSFTGLAAGNYCLKIVHPTSGSCPRWDHASTPTVYTLTLSESESVIRYVGFDNSACSVD